MDAPAGEEVVVKGSARWRAQVLAREEMLMVLREAACTAMEEEMDSEVIEGTRAVARGAATEEMHIE